MSELKLNKSVPKFSLLNQNSEKISLSDFKGKNIVIYFYPKAMTPGCTVQACGIRDFKKEFAKLNTVVLGISSDLPEKLLKFKEKQNLNFELLSDPDHKVCELYGVWNLKKFMGREFMGIVRTTFIIDENGKLIHIMDDVKTKSHHDDVIALLKELL